MTRTWAFVAAAVVAVGIGGTFLLTQLRAPTDRLEACLRGSVAGGDIGGPFTLVSETGETVTQDDVITAPTLVYFGYTFCPDVCPLDTDRNAAAMEILDEQGIEMNALFVTIDPERDTAEYLAEYTDAFHPRMVGLTGSQEQVDAAVKAYRVYAKQQESDDPEFYLMDHSNMTYLMDPEAGFVTFFRGDVAPEAMAEQLACISKVV